MKVLIKTKLYLPCIILLVFLSYFNSLNNSFHYDDFHMIVENDYLKDPDKLPLLFSDTKSASAGEAARGNYRPLVMFSYALNYMMGGGDSTIYIVTDIFIHIGTCMLLYLLVLQIGGSVGAAFASSLLFAVTPANNETVNYITARSGLLATFFYLAAFYFFVRFRQQCWQKDLESGHKTGISFFFLFLLAMVASILSKEIGITIIAIVFLYDLCYMENKRLKDFVPYIFLGAGFILYFVIRFSIFQNQLHLDFSKIVLAPVLVVKYIFHFFIPYPLNIDHFFELDRTVLDPLFIFACILLLVYFAWVIKYGRKQPILLFTSLWFFVTLSPVLFLVLITKSALFQENRGYLSYVGLSIFIVTIVSNIYNRKSYKFMNINIANMFYAFIVIISIVGNIARNRDWQNEKTLWGKALKYNPNSFFAHHSIGNQLHDEGRLQEAITEYEKAISINPEYVFSYNNLGKAYKELGNKSEAMRYYKKAAEVSKGYSLPHFNLANIYLEQGEFSKAVNEYNKSLFLNPTYHMANLYMGVAYMYLQNYKKAGEQFEMVLNIVESADAYANLGIVQITFGKLDDAERNLLQSIVLKPVYPEAYFNLGIVYQKSGKNLKAIEFLEKAIKQKNNYPGANFNLANLYFHRGDISKALKFYQLFIKLTPDRSEFVKPKNFALEQVRLLKNQSGGFRDFITD